MQRRRGRRPRLRRSARTGPPRSGARGSLMRATSVATLLLVASAPPARAYRRTETQPGSGIYLFWGPRGHNFQMDALGTPDVSGTAAFDAIRKSFATWAGVSCSDLLFPEVVPLEQGDRRIGFFPGSINRNLILFRTQRCDAVVPANDPCLTQGGCTNKYDCWDRGGAIIATTVTTFSASTGQIFDADIEINDAPAANSSKFTFTTVDAPPCPPGGPVVNCVSIDVQNTITHEAGHTLGLDHSADPSATMAASAPAGETSKRVLQPDDITGICAIYPRGAQTATSVGDPIRLEPAGSGCGCSSGRGGLASALWPLVLVALARARRSGRRSSLAAQREDPGREGQGAERGGRGETWIGVQPEERGRRREQEPG
ncbi:MAG: matrixin family metalloprotease [Deltaproteobacteria bacterium]|nr:MAG: matrixin family metalloprotease [Deltaproteobacteria bacterium]